ncbi:MAG: hypothetical protein ACO264_01830, partial [Burkholderiaceae bacterium]
MTKTLWPGSARWPCAGLTSISHQWPNFRLKSWNYAIFEATFDHPLDRPQFAHITDFNHRDCNTTSSGARRATNSVNIVFGLHR